MMQAIKGQVFDGQRLWAERTLYLDAQGRVLDDAVADGTQIAHLEGVLMPGFVDLQVNGGDGVMLGDVLSPDGVARIAAAHQRLGCAGILPTLITDRPAQVTAAIAAVAGQSPKARPACWVCTLRGRIWTLSARGPMTRR